MLEHLPTIHKVHSIPRTTKQNKTIEHLLMDNHCSNALMGLRFIHDNSLRRYNYSLRLEMMRVLPKVINLENIQQGTMWYRLKKSDKFNVSSMVSKAFVIFINFYYCIVIFYLYVAPFLGTENTHNIIHLCIPDIYHNHYHIEDTQKCLVN